MQKWFTPGRVCFLQKYIMRVYSAHIPATSCICISFNAFETCTEGHTHVTLIGGDPGGRRAGGPRGPGGPRAGGRGPTPSWGPPGKRAQAGARPGGHASAPGPRAESKRATTTLRECGVRGNPHLEWVVRQPHRMIQGLPRQSPTRPPNCSARGRRDAGDSCARLTLNFVWHLCVCSREPALLSWSC